MSTTQNNVELFIQQARDLLKPKPVEHHPLVPGWLRRRLLSRLGTAGWHVTDAWTLIHHWAAQFGAGKYPDGAAWLDHCGTCRLSSGGVEWPCFVGEPYNGTREVLLPAFMLAERLDLFVTVDPDSWHYPGWTIRIVLWPFQASDGEPIHELGSHELDRIAKQKEQAEAEREIERVQRYAAYEASTL